MRRGVPFERPHGEADTGIRAEVRDRLAAVLFAQHLLAVVDDSVHQMPAGVFIQARIAAVVNAQLAVKITRYHPVSVHHLVHAGAQAEQVAGQGGGQRRDRPARPRRAHSTMAPGQAQNARPIGNS